MLDSVAGGVIIVCVLPVVIGLLGAHLRSTLLGAVVVVVGPVVVSYALAQMEMSPRLHPGAESPKPWDLIATTVWSLWSVPVAVGVLLLQKWRQRSRRPNAT